jgi:hypothetical protein
MVIFDFILQDHEACYNLAQSIALDGAVLMESGSSEKSRPRHSRPEGEPVNGVQIWYDYGADYYFFEDLEA